METFVYSIQVKRFDCITLGTKPHPLTLLHRMDFLNHADQIPASPQAYDHGDAYIAEQNRLKNLYLIDRKMVVLHAEELIDILFMSYEEPAEYEALARAWKNEGVSYAIVCNYWFPLHKVIRQLDAFHELHEDMDETAQNSINDFLQAWFDEYNTESCGLACN